MKQNWGASCNGCADGPECLYKSPLSWIQEPERIASVVDGLVTSLRIALTKDGHVRCFQYGRMRYMASSCLGNDVSASLLLGQDVNLAQPIMQVHDDQTPCSAVLDSSCSHTIVSTRLCHTVRGFGKV